MEYNNIIQPLWVAFNEDIRLNNGPSHITDLMVLTIKSLIPSEEHVGVYVDYKRFNEEMKLWKYYRHGENVPLLNILEGGEPSIYWNRVDDTAYFRLIPIVLVNKDYSFMQKEVIKNLLFTTGNINTIIEGVLLSKLLYLLLNKEGDLIEKLKNEIISFSQVKFIEEYMDYIRVPLNSYPKNFTVTFEKYKIDALNALNFSHTNNFSILIDCLDLIINGNPTNILFGKVVNALIGNNKKIDKYINNSFYEELCIYVYNLRKGRINPKALKIKKYYLPNIFELNVGDKFYHSLLNYAQVVKKDCIEGKTIVYLNTKSGMYKFTN